MVGDGMDVVGDGMDEAGDGMGCGRVGMDVVGDDMGCGSNDAKSQTVPQINDRRIRAENHIAVAAINSFCPPHRFVGEVLCDVSVQVLLWWLSILPR